MPEGKWISPRLAALELREPGSKAPLELSIADAHRTRVLPGSLRSEIRLEEIELHRTLWFASARSAVLRVELINRGERARSFDASWTGGVFADASLEIRNGGVVAFSSAGHALRIDAQGAGAPMLLAAESEPVSAEENEVRHIGRRYRWPLAEILHLAPGERRVLHVVMSDAVEGAAPTAETGREVLMQVSRSWSECLRRWNAYLDAVDTGRSRQDPVQIVAVKSLMTLVNNWRAPAGRMNHDALFPSSNVWYFNGFWAWDSWKHAVGVLPFDPELAKEQVRAMFAHQDEHGMIADVVYLDASEDNWRDSKPPLAGWAVREIFEATGDLDFAREIYPRLVDYHRFWYADRDHDRDGLCEYGSTDGTLVAARWESGMDNAVRFDDTRMLRNSAHAWSMDQASVDLNSYLFAEKEALAILADALGNREAAEAWSREAATLRDLIRERMYDEETGWFYDVRLESGEFVPVQGPEGWIPLWAGVASPEQAARVRDTLLDPEKFGTRVPFPTVSRADPGFSDGYWRGLVWLDQACFAIQGLWRYGFESDARRMRDRLFANLEGATTPGEALRENYHPLTGEGRNVRHFSWTAAHLLMLTQSPPVNE